MVPPYNAGGSTNKPKFIYQLPYLALRDLGRILDDNNQWKELGKYTKAFYHL